MPPKYLVLVIIGMISIATIYLISASLIYPELSPRADFGTVFGGIDTIFSGIAFLGIIFTIFLQKTELELQRKELKATRQELARTAEAQERSEKALTKQAESLKMTAKLNGLSSLLQYEIAKPDVFNKKPWEIMSAFDVDTAEDITLQIQHIIDQK